MKIFMLTDSMDIGGAETHIYELSRLLSLRGHQVTVISSGGRLAALLPRIGVRHLTLPSVSDPLTAISAISVLARYLRREKPQVVHAHTRRTAFLCHILLAMFDFPLIVTAHAMFSHRFPLNRLSFFPRATVAVSVDIQKALSRNFSVPTEHITVIPNGIDTERFCPRHVGERPLTVLSVSRLDSECAHTARLLCAAAPLFVQKTERPVRILIVGDGDAFSEIQAMAERTNRALGNSVVELLGGRTDVHRLLNECHIFVGVSRAALEAMSSARPVILSGDEGYLGIVDQRTLSAARRGNFCARGYKPATVTHLLNDLLYLAGLSPSAREELGVWGREVVRKFYSAEAMADATEALYRRERARFRDSRRSDALICGYYGYGNCGDELVLKSIVENQLALCSSLRLSVLTAAKAAPYGTRGISRYHIPSVLREIWGTGAFIMGGGSLLQDGTSFRSLLYYLSLLVFANVRGIPTMLYANGIGPLSPRAYGLCRKVLLGVDIISLRDRDSYEMVRAMKLPHTRLIMGADPILTARPSGATVSRTPPYIAFFPRGGCERHEARALVEAVAALAKKKDFGVILAPMSVAEDTDAILFAVEMLQERGVKWVTVGSPHPDAISRLIRQSKLTVSERLHALILAFSFGVPPLGIDRDPKIPSFLREAGLGHCVVKNASELVRVAEHATAPTTHKQAILHVRARRDARVANQMIMSDTCGRGRSLF